MAASTKTKGWRFRNSLWLILAFLPIFNFTAFMYIAKKVKNKKYRLLAAIHTALTIVQFVFCATSLAGVVVVLAPIHYCWIVIQCIAKCSEYLTLLERKENLGVLTAQLNRNPVVKTKISTATESKIETVAEEKISADKVNVNTCSEEDLMNLPGISVVEAKKAIAYRNQNGDYPSVESFITALGLKPHIAVGIVERITAEIPEEHAVVHKVAVRQLDF